MALSTALYTILRLNSDIVTTFATRIFPGAAPEDTALPCIVYEITNITPTIAIGALADWDQCEIQVTVISTKHSLTETYAGYVRTALDGYSGTQDTEVVNEIVYNSQDASYDPDWTVSGSAQGIGVFVRTLYFTLIRT